MDALIISYHIAVILIILITFAATILSIAKIGPFAQVSPNTTRILLTALVLELVAAFIGVYKALPELKFDVSEKYRFEIKYADVSSQWLDGLSDVDRQLLAPFIDDLGVSAFYQYLSFADRYRHIKHLSVVAGTDWLGQYLMFLNDEDKEYLDIFVNIYQESPSKLRSAEALIEIYQRKRGSANKTGSGDMWASISGNKMKGIVVYTFPGDQQVPTVLEFEGQMLKEADTESLKLDFIQSTSAVVDSGKYFERPGGRFSVKLSKNGKEEVYQGTLKDVGVVKIQVWELL